MCVCMCQNIRAYIYRKNKFIYNNINHNISYNTLLYKKKSYKHYFQYK